eukprot:gene36367-44115_t
MLKLKLQVTVNLPASASLSFCSTSRHRCGSSSVAEKLQPQKHCLWIDSVSLLLEVTSSLIRS